MTPDEQQTFVKYIKAACEPIGEKVKSGEIDCAFIGVTFGRAATETGVWYEEFGNQCAVRQLSDEWGKPIRFSITTDKELIAPFQVMLSDKRLVAAVLLFYANAFRFDHCGCLPACDWLIKEHQIRNDQIIRTQFATITAQNIAIQQQMHRGPLITPDQLKGPNGPFFRAN
jgi:hypothetical protein